jgi:hypothetical protein
MQTDNSQKQIGGFVRFLSSRQKFARLFPVRRFSFNPQSHSILVRKTVRREGYSGSFTCCGDGGNSGRRNDVAMPLKVYNRCHIEARGNGQDGLGYVQKSLGSPYLCTGNASLLWINFPKVTKVSYVLVGLQDR